jgi:hypothetical protein
MFAFPRHLNSHPRFVQSFPLVFCVVFCGSLSLLIIVSSCLRCAALFDHGFMSCHKHIEFPIIGLSSKNIVVLITRHANNYGSNYFTEKARNNVVYLYPGVVSEALRILSKLFQNNTHSFSVWFCWAMCIPTIFSAPLIQPRGIDIQHCFSTAGNNTKRVYAGQIYN